MIAELLFVALVISAVLAAPLVFPTLLIDSVAYALRWRPDDFKGWTFYGELLLRKRQYEHALHALNTAIKIRPGYAKAWKSLGDTLLRMGDKERADTAYGFAEEGDSEPL
jgi:cytochrome c-type biogenesis protein CcmH/NrfG